MTCRATVEHLTCEACSLHQFRTQVVPGHGSIDARIALVGEAPGKDEDMEGHPFVGRAGQLLDELLERAGIDQATIWRDNVVHCRPPNNAIREYPDAVSRCPDLWLKPTLAGLQNLRAVVTLGATAGQLWFSGKRAGEIAVLARAVCMQGPRAIRIVGSYHPAYALREGPWVSDSIVASLSRALIYSQLG